MKLLADSDWLVGLFRIGDPHQEVATRLLHRIDKDGVELSVLNLVIQEAATVLSHRTGMRAVRLFCKRFPDLGLNTTWVDEALEADAWKIFLKQTKKGTSFVDCANLAVIKELKLDGILSFDSFYPKKLTRWMKG